MHKSINIVVYPVCYINRAAFQYGLKMSDGRKTRRYPKGGDEKAKLDREWQKISAIISKRQGVQPTG